LRTVVWKSCSSSESAVNAGGGVSRESRAGMSEAYSKEEFLAKHLASLRLVSKGMKLTC
jgi:hypothetical protein